MTGRPFGIALNMRELWRLIANRDEAVYRLNAAAGLGNQTLYRVLRRGRAHRLTIEKLAKALNVEPESLWLNHELGNYSASS